MRKLMALCVGALLAGACGDDDSTAIPCLDAPCPRASDTAYVRTAEDTGNERFWDQADRNCIVFHPGPSGSLGDATLREALVSAARTWTRAAEACQAALCIQVGDPVDSPEAGNVVYAVDDPARWEALAERTDDQPSAPSNPRLGACITRFEPGGRLVSADIALNLVEFDFSQRPDGPRAAEQDLESVILHELGHAIGFAHTGDGVDSVMSETLVERVRRGLTPVDTAGVCETFARPPEAANQRRADTARNALPTGTD